MRSALLLLFGLTLAVCRPAIAEAPSSAEMISNYRLQNREGRVALDAALNGIAQEQANAMASRDVLDHSVLGPFSSRVARAGSTRAAENIAYGYDTFAKTLDQWIDSAEHRKNLLMHDASRVGIASAKSPTTGRTYWAMVIAGGYKRAPSTALKQSRRKTCRITILNLCL